MKKPPLLSQSDKTVLTGRHEHVPIHRLKPHEAILESRLPEIISAIKKGKLLNGTIVVSTPHYIILDGHHRVASLKKLGAKKIPAFVIPYLDNPNIQVGTWFPTVQWSFSWEWALEELKAQLDINLVEIKINRYRFEQDLQTRDEIKDYFVFIPWQFINLPTVQGFILPTNQKTVLDAIKQLGGKIDFLPTLHDAMEVATKRKTFFLARRTPTKADVINAALSKNLFAPKTTRHVLLQEMPKRTFNFRHFIDRRNQNQYRFKRKDSRLRYDR